MSSIEFQGGSGGAIHHANIKIDRTRGSRRLDDGEPGPGYNGGGGRDATFPDGYFLGWTPGQLARSSPEEMSWRITPDSDLVVELHMVPTGHEQPVQFSVGLIFTDRPPTRQPYMLRLGRQDIDIPAGTREHVVTDSFVLPVDVEVLAVQPHAHHLAREVSGFATLPDGSRQELIHIKEWNFHWQDVYRYRAPVRLPQGTALSMRYRYDNSAGNRRNPYQPPRRVTFGQTTAAEMGDLWLQVVPVRHEDRAALDAAFTPKMLSEDIAGYMKVLETDPGDARAHHDLAACLLEIGRVDAAIGHLEEAVRLEPDTPWASYDLGTVLLKGQRLDDAERHFRRAIAVKPDFAEAHNNLGVVHYLRGQLAAAIRSYQTALRSRRDHADAHYNLGRALAAQERRTEAIAAYREALSLEPDSAETHTGLAGVLASEGRLGEAIPHYRRALELDPALPAALVDLAWLLASSARADVRAPEEAVRLAERGVELTGRADATALETLAIAYAAAGRTERAIETAEAAIEAAVTAGQHALAGQIRSRLATWRPPR